MKLSIKDVFSKCDLVHFAEEILNGKLHSLCSEITAMEKENIQLLNACYDQQFDFIITYNK